MISFFVANPPLTAIIWMVLYLLDFSLTFWCSRLYQQSLSTHIIFEGGTEMNPLFEKDVADLRPNIPRLLLTLYLVVTILNLSGKLGSKMVDFEFLAGAALLLWVFIDLQHLRNIYLYLHVKERPEALEGQIKRTYWLDQRLIAYDAFTFSVVYGLAWSANGMRFFLGGAFACFELAAWHFYLSGRQFERESHPHCTKKTRVEVGSRVE
jgi:hypothetical protein